MGSQQDMATDGFRVCSGEWLLGRSSIMDPVLPASESQELRGSIDDFVGLYMTGWAFLRPNHICRLEVRDQAGAVVATGNASLPRSDLIALGLGPCAFRIALPDRDAPETLVVTADGHLFGAPITVGRGLFDGSLTISNGDLAGWVAERSRSREAPRVEITDSQGNVLLAIRTLLSDASSDPLCRPWRFFAPVPEACIGRPGMVLELRANGQRVGTPLSVTLLVEGHLDRLEPGRCAGWLGSQQAPNRRFEIEAFRDHKIVGKGIAHQSHPLAKGPNPGAWEVGFDILLDPPREGMGTNFEMSLRIAGTSIELFDGPFIVGDRASLIESSRSVASLSRSGAVGLDAAQAAVVQAALGRYIDETRQGEIFSRIRVARQANGRREIQRLNIVIPIYRGLEVTRACIDSVLAQRDPFRDTVVLINDFSPEAGMQEMLRGYAQASSVVLIENEENQGFVRSVNRGLLACPDGDVLLLNSDTRLFSGALNELVAVAESSRDIGTVTALSNNATIFSYPSINATEEKLEDISWEEIALFALINNQGRSIDVPTAHGFCMLITRPMLDSVGLFDEGFGRGYGEENDYCQRGADLGFRHVAAAGVFVEHRERTSFGTERDALLQANLPRLAKLYPEYDTAVAKFEVRDPLHVARWPLHRHRLEKARVDAQKVILTVSHQLGGGTGRAEKEIEAAAKFDDALRLRLSATVRGAVELECQNPKLAARFDQEETGTLFEFLERIGVDTVIVHHTLGFEPEVIERIGDLAKGRRAIWYVHDFYAICPRTTLIDALGEFCGGPEDGRCARCIDLGGAHEASRTNALTPQEHRALFRRVLSGMTVVAAPSDDAARHLSDAMPGLPLLTVPHPQIGIAFPPTPRPGSWNDIALLGAIGPHKGSAQLLQLARRALLTHPSIRFHIIGYTDIDAELRALSNVSITGPYGPDDLERLIGGANARIALFLHQWPETYSYTLTEAVAHGLVPVVPDIGAPAERVRATGFGVIFPFPFNAASVLDTLAGLAGTHVPFATDSASPLTFADPSAVARVGALLRGDQLAEPDEAPVKAAKRPRIRRS